MSLEGSLPLIALCYVDQVAGTVKLIKQIRDEWKGVVVLLSDTVEAVIVYGKAERTILLLDEEDGGTG